MQPRPLMERDSDGSKPLPEPPPEAWSRAFRAGVRVRRRALRLVHRDTTGGLVLLGAALVAFAWANSPWHASYEALWSTPVELAVGRHRSSETLRFWMNEGLMVLFFFAVGLEIRREIHTGELSRWRRAVLPIAAALGGMVVPALVYTMLVPEGAASRGWAIPMATDIAFAVGVLALLGDRVPPAVRVFLLALAIIDDVGAIAVIAVFYSGSLDPSGLALAGAALAAVFTMQRVGVRHPALYVPVGALLWLGMHEAHIHPTLAGVVLGLATPVRAWLAPARFGAIAERALREIRDREPEGNPVALVAPLSRLERARREALPPVVRLESALHGWVALGVMPLFALANAGVRVADVDLGAPGALGVAAGVTLGLLLGKPLGIVLASWLAVRAGAAALPTGVGWRGVLLVGAAGGVGFTMSIFLASLALEPPLLDVAKAAVLAGSAAAALGALALGRATTRGAETVRSLDSRPSVS